MPLESSMLVQVKADLTSSSFDFTTPSAGLSRAYQVLLANGTAAGQADQIWHDQRTLAASTTEDLDLAGVLVNALGATVTFARVKGLLVAAAAGNTNNVVLGAAAVNPWAALLGATGTLIVRPGTVVAVLAGQADAIGYAVTAGTGDLLKVANSAGGSSVIYDIVLLGATA